LAAFLGRWRARARELKIQVHALGLACRDPRTPWYAKAFAALVAAYALSPIDLIPDFIPVLGQLDDLLLVPRAVGAARGGRVAGAAGPGRLAGAAPPLTAGVSSHLNAAVDSPRERGVLHPQPLELFLGEHEQVDPHRKRTGKVIDNALVGPLGRVAHYDAQIHVTAGGRQAIYPRTEPAYGQDLGVLPPQPFGVAPHRQADGVGVSLSYANRTR